MMKQTKIIFSITFLISLFSGIVLSANNSNILPDDTLKSENDKVINSKYGVTVGDSVKCVENLSLYREYYNQWKKSGYKNEEMIGLAYPRWRENCDICPKVSLNLYFRGSRILEYKIANAEDSITKEKYIDTLMMLYDKRIENFGDHPKYGKASALGYKAMDLYKYRKYDPQGFYNAFENAFEVGGNSTSPSTIQGYFNSSVIMAKADSIPWSQVIFNYLEIKEVVNYNINKKSISDRDSLRYEQAGLHLEKLMVAIATCDNIEKIFTPEYRKDSTNVQLLRAIIRLSDIRQCTDHELYYKAATQLHSIEPSPLSALSLGKLNMKKEDYKSAEGYLEEATSSFADSLRDQKADAFLLYAECLRNLNKYSSARSAARKVLEFRPDDARAYIIVGDLYASSASSCDFKGLKTAYWVAYDEYSKAMSAVGDDNDKLKEIIRQKMYVMSSNFPPAEEVFMRNLKEDASFTVECWINQSTKVRAR